MSVIALISALSEVLHRIRVKLYPNYLKGIKGAYIAHVRDEALLTIRDVIASLKNRAGFTGKAEDAIDYYDQIMAEAKYQLCDGFAVNFGPFSVHPHVGGTWDKENEADDREKHPISFRYRTRAELRMLTSQIEIEVDGIADVNGYIDEITDVATESVNETLTPHGMFVITGYKIKVVGPDAAVGISFVLASDPTQYALMDGHLAENERSKLIGIVPDIPPGQWKVKIVTQYTGSGSTLLKEPRTIESKVEFTVV
jgi:hypothetical protein